MPIPQHWHIAAISDGKTIGLLSLEDHFSDVLERVHYPPLRPEHEQARGQPDIPCEVLSDAEPLVLRNPGHLDGHPLMTF
jgi:hypothetical protein